MKEKSEKTSSGSINFSVHCPFSFSARWARKWNCSSSGSSSRTSSHLIHLLFNISIISDKLEHRVEPSQSFSTTNQFIFREELEGKERDRGGRVRGTNIIFSLHFVYNMYAWNDYIGLLITVYTAEKKFSFLRWTNRNVALRIEEAERERKREREREREREKERK